MNFIEFHLLEKSLKNREPDGISKRYQAREGSFQT